MGRERSFRPVLFRLEAIGDGGLDIVKAGVGNDTGLLPRGAKSNSLVVPPIRKILGSTTWRGSASGPRLLSRRSIRMSIAVLTIASDGVTTVVNGFSR